jgi:hypothetical protein
MTPMRWPIAVALSMLVGLSACAPEKPDPKKDRGNADKKSPPPPCHPGCFPAGTLVATPEGPRPIEAVGRGDRALVVTADGTTTAATVDSTFQTCNKLMEVQTDQGQLLTTTTQPLCLVSGGFRPAGELAEGDRVWRWEGDERRAARVFAVVATGREAEVYNLVVGESAVFVAGGFLARGKPPLDGTE